MYFVDREYIEHTLRFLEETIRILEDKHDWNHIVEKKALERLVHTAIESVLDVGNAMIDGFIMRDPGSFEDIVDIMEDEKVIGAENAKDLKEIIHLRKLLVQQYIVIDHSLLLTTINDHLQSLRTFPTSIRSYLENELGPVSAFRN